MVTPITMPQLGESVTEGVISRWLKAEGDHVERDESLVEIVTDKVNAEMPSPVAGTLVKIIAPEGATIPVGGELAEIEGDATVPASAIASAGNTGATAPAERDSGAAVRAEPVAVGEDADAQGHRRAYGAQRADRAARHRCGRGGHDAAGTLARNQQGGGARTPRRRHYLRGLRDPGRRGCAQGGPDHELLLGGGQDHSQAAHQRRRGRGPGRRHRGAGDTRRG